MPPLSSTAEPISSSAQITAGKNRWITLGLPIATALAVLAITALGAQLRFQLLGRRSFWLDEGVSIAIARLDWWNFLRLLWRREGNMSFYYLLLRAWLHAGHSEAFIRTLSVLPSIATIPALYLAGRRLFGRFVGLASALLLALNAYHIRYAQEARSYSMAVLLVVLSSLYFVRLIEKPTPRDARLHLLTSVLAVYSHFFAVLVIVAQWTSLRFLQPPGAYPQRGWGFRKIAYWVAPLFLFIATTGAGPISWIPKPSLQSVHGLGIYLSGLFNDRILYFYYLCILVVVGITIYLWWRRNTPGPPLVLWRYGFVVCWLFVPIVITLVVSLVRSTFLPRYLLICLPALCLCIAVAISRLPFKVLPLAALALFSFFAFSGLKRYYNGASDIAPEDWRGATQDVMAHAQAGDAVLFHNGMGRMPFEYYEGNSAGKAPKPTVVFPNREGRLTFRDFMGKPDIALLNELPKRYDRVWVVLSHVQSPTGMDPTATLIRGILRHGYRNAGESQFDGITVVLYSESASRTRP